jgi:hypothetical protein
LQVLGIGSLSAAFLGGIAIRDNATSIWAWFAIGCFLLLVILTVSILLPRKWRASHDPVVLIDWVEAKATTAQMQKRLAQAYGDSFNENHDKIRNLTRTYVAAIIALVAELIFLVLNLI